MTGSGRASGGRPGSGRWRKARAGGHSAEIAREGALLEPDAALRGVAPPPGDYRCRVLKLGGQGEGMLDYVAYP